MDKTTLVRIVQLTIHPHITHEFLGLFDEVSTQIRSFKGCEHLELLQNPTYPNVLTTYSHWQAEEFLEAYRKSALFKSTWAKTKLMFAAPPLATSYFRIRQIT